MTQATYTLGEEIGRGALGRVHRVYEESSDRVYAGKILHSSHQIDAQAQARFESEAEVASSLHHENIVRVYGLTTIAKLRVMRMELVEGPSLAKHLAIVGPLPEAKLCGIAKAITSGLRAAHIAGFVHRDLKPQNILLTPDGVPKIADFGMARATSFSGVDPSAFVVAGTPDYMAPECIDPLAVDARSDLYSLGCMLYEMAVGRPPYQGKTAFAVLRAHRTAPLPELPTNYSKELQQIIHKLLTKSPAERIQSAAGLEEALQLLCAPQSTTSAALLPFLKGDLTRTSSDGVCAECKQPMVAGIPVCFSCGSPQLSIDKGNYKIVVVGPGKVGEKLDSAKRATLLDWLADNPTLHLNTQALSKKVPRLPFVLLSGTSKSSALAIQRSLAEKEITVDSVKGTALRHRDMRKKNRIMAGRTLGIGAMSGAGLWSPLSSFGIGVLPVLGGLVAAAVGITAYRSSKQTTTRSPFAKTSLSSSSLQSAIAEFPPVLANMQRQRHRENLRGIATRVLATAKSLPQAMQDSSEEDLAKLLRMSLIASARMDEIDEVVANSDMRNPSPLTLTLLRERDRWAGRLLETTAFLDSMRARSIALQHMHPATEQENQHSLDDLKLQIAALEEIADL